MLFALGLSKKGIAFRVFLLACCLSAMFACNSLLAENNEEEGRRYVMTDKVTTTIIELPEGKFPISVKDLERLKSDLKEMLRQKEPASLFGHLVGELDRSGTVIMPDGYVFIGSWHLIVRDSGAVFQRQRMPRARNMIFYEARLTVENGQWQIKKVSYARVQGLGYLGNSGDPFKIGG
jgi:hypothetical protein